MGLSSGNKWVQYWLWPMYELFDCAMAVFLVECLEKAIRYGIFLPCMLWLSVDFQQQQFAFTMVCTCKFGLHGQVNSTKMNLVCDENFNCSCLIVNCLTGAYILKPRTVIIIDFRCTWSQEGTVTVFVNSSPSGFLSSVLELLLNCFGLLVIFFLLFEIPSHIIVRWFVGSSFPLCFLWSIHSWCNLTSKCW